ncbi:large subunit of alpha-aminoadipate reductase [Sorochytrium milnesiophthora]
MADQRAVVVLISGNGSNLQALIDAAESGTLPARIALVVSNRSNAFGLQRASKHNIPTLVHTLKPYKDRATATYREEYDADLAQAILEHTPDPRLVVLAGFMHILSPRFLQHFPRKVINLHPALPGQFDGAHAIERAFEAYKAGSISSTGVMVHHVIPEVDRGEVIVQRSVPIEPSDTLQTLEERIHAVEHDLIVEGAHYPRHTPSRHVEAQETADLSASTCRAILSLLHQLRNDSVSPFQMLLAAFAVLMHRYTGESDVPVGSSSADGNPLVLRLPLQSTDSFATVVDTICQVEQQAEADVVPFSQLVQHLGKQQSLFKVRFFNLTDTTDTTLSATAAHSDDKDASSTSDLTVVISQSSSLRRLLPVTVRLTYNAALYSQRRIQHMVSQLCAVLESAAAQDPHTVQIGAMSLVTLDALDALPDPTLPLEWDQWPGAITDVFAANARKHPDRACVVDTDSAFTYAQIHRASNMVAHYLLRSGVQREDVVMLYSYRGVDLVVAIMGVLTAGATFSVIDPAYPPPRQIVYLSAAKPRALVVLHKAGSIDPTVWQYMAESLELKCEIPALQLNANGHLTGGSLFGGGDVLDTVRDMQDTFPNVILGPDSVGTLSFTSGSTGIPKGVRGRHFSLTHFYLWMQKRFALSQHDRFTMLSGIAHDPIQRDIFTPLFLGAQLCIPTADNIGTPGRLSQWMAETAISVTHLTPAMGQVLSANATHAIPTLRHAFLVGDVLTKRDVLRLQQLAPHCTVVNMYGTTETQRAVSYTAIPALADDPSFMTQQKDIMPAGVGMKNVQLLVLNAQRLLCGVGEVGELYVRSSGLAEGYLGLDDTTASKFLANPFATRGTAATSPGVPYFYGPRDRMYRTGDLGRYRPDGCVECSGRADDQVKIRGFRIELGEVDTYLSQHPRVRENVTLVRRDKFEEQTLVSYIVPVAAAEQSGSYVELIKDVRQFLKTKLPTYSVPSVIVPMRKLPLTPNGKVDKNALPFPDTAVQSTMHPQSEPAMTRVQLALLSIWQQLLNVADAVGPDDDFFDLGGHSILATRLIFEIRTRLAINVPLGLVFRCPTFAAMGAELEGLVANDLQIAADAGATDMQCASPPPSSKHASDKCAVDCPYPYARHAETLPSEITATGLTPARHTPAQILLTGATGFLGAFLVRELLHTFPQATLIALARADSDTAALDRVRNNCLDHGCWPPDASARVRAVAGDLALPHWGLSDSSWAQLADCVDIIVHNGALVHWVYPYSKLAGANVDGTLTALRLATQHRLKQVCFVSSTSVLDTEHYTRLMDLEDGRNAVLETDTLEGAGVGLRTGYAQTKWVAERLCMAALRRGVPVSIVRPGYIVGDSVSGVTNADDFIWRLVKGCIDLQQTPVVNNVINVCAVDDVARTVGSIVSAAATGVFHVWNSQRVRFRYSDLFQELQVYGYNVAPTEYVHWRAGLMDLTAVASQADTHNNALYPLLHFVLDDLPTSTKAPMLDDRRTRAVLSQTAAPTFADMHNCMGLYLSFLVQSGFLPPPPSTTMGKRPLPHLPVSTHGAKVLTRRQ